MENEDVINHTIKKVEIAEHIEVNIDENNKKTSVLRKAVKKTKETSELSVLIEEYYVVGRAQLESDFLTAFGEFETYEYLRKKYKEKTFRDFITDPYTKRIRKDVNVEKLVQSTANDETLKMLKSLQ